MPLQNADPAASVLAHRQPALNDLAQQHVPHAVHWAILCGKALLGEGNCLLPQWEARIHQLLDDDSPDAAITELMECLPFTTSEEQLNALDDVVGYYRSNQKRMQYRIFRQRGLPVGSGIVESAHRHVLQTRMKRAGRRWGFTRARRMVRLRAAYRTAGAFNFHSAIRAALKAPPALTAHRPLPNAPPRVRRTYLRPQPHQPAQPPRARLKVIVHPARGERRREFRLLRQ